MQTATIAQLAAISAATPIQYGPLATALKEKNALLRTMRNNVMDLVEDKHIFSDAERLRTNDSVYQTESIPQLQRWFRNVYRILKERETMLHMAFADGSYVHVPVAR